MEKLKQFSKKILYIILDIEAPRKLPEEIRIDEIKPAPPPKPKPDKTILGPPEIIHSIKKHRKKIIEVLNRITPFLPEDVFLFKSNQDYMTAIRSPYDTSRFRTFHKKSRDSRGSFFHSGSLEDRKDFHPSSLKALQKTGAVISGKAKKNSGNFIELSHYSPDKQIEELTKLGISYFYDCWICLEKMKVLETESQNTEASETTIASQNLIFLQKSLLEKLKEDWEDNVRELSFFLRDSKGDMLSPEAKNFPILSETNDKNLISSESHLNFEVQLKMLFEFYQKNEKQLQHAVLLEGIEKERYTKKIGTKLDYELKKQSRILIQFEHIEIKTNILKLQSILNFLLNP